MALLSPKQRSASKLLSPIGTLNNLLNKDTRNDG